MKKAILKSLEHSQENIKVESLFNNVAGVQDCWTSGSLTCTLEILFLFR